MCLELNMLPDAGGLFDQDPLWVRRLQIVQEARYQAEKMRMQKEESAAKHKAAVAAARKG